MKRINRALPFILLAALPGCGRIIDWGSTIFYQGDEIVDLATRVAPFIRSVTILDQLETKATFEILWLNDTVRTVYSELHILRQGKTEQKLQAVLRRQLEENNLYISFYVLSLHDVKLGIPESQWTFFIRVNDNEYHPCEIKEVLDLPYEYQVFFGKKWNRFKVPYLMRFRANDMTTNSPIINEETSRLTLIARSAHKEHAFVWQLIPEPEAPAPIVKKRRGKKS